MDTPASRTSILHAAAEIAATYLEGDQTEPVTLAGGLDDHARAVDLRLGLDGQTADEVIADLRAVVQRTPRTGSPRFANQLFGGHPPIPVAAEMLTAAMNSSMYTHRVAGPHAIIESIVLERMLNAAGLRGGEGMFCPGGSISNLVAMIAARNHAVPDAKECGLDGRRLRAYASAAAHYSNRKNAMMVGIGRRNLVEIAVDARGRMHVGALTEAVSADRNAGHTPCMVIATAGTTVTGAFDPIQPIADITDAEGLWLHVDGALGSSALLSNAHKGLLDGVDRADSLAWNAHKLLGVPLSCAAILVRQPGVLTDAFDETADYLFQSTDCEPEPGTRSMQCGRRNDAFKLWAAWRHLGDRGLAARVDRLFQLAAEAADIVRAADDLTLALEPASVTVCFTLDGMDSRTICGRLLKAGTAMVSHADVHGQTVIRLACVNPDWTSRDLHQFFGAVRAAAACGV